MRVSGRLTLRSIGARLRAALEREAERRGQSPHEAARALLSERLGLAEETAAPEYDDLDELAGTWSDAEADRFEAALKAQRPIDARLWR